MLVHFDVEVVLLLFCLAQGLTTAAGLLLARPRRAGSGWLGLLVLGLTLQVLDYFLSRSGVYFRHRGLYFTPLFFSWSFGPLLLSWARAHFGAGRRLAGGHWLPGAVQLLFYAGLSAQSFDTKTWFWLAVHKPITRYVEHYGAVISMLVYLALVWRLGRAQIPRPRGLPGLLAGLAAFYLAAALDPLLNAAYLPAGAPKFYLTSLVLPALAYGLALLGWRTSRPAVLGPAPALPAPPPPTPKAPAAPPDPAQLTRLIRVMTVEQLYQNPDLTLAELARHLGLTPNAASALVNAGLGVSFTDWVNGYRLAEVERRLLTADVQRFTVLALAFDAGFNSKTTFNRVFKEKTGLTPSAYLKKYQSALRDDGGAAAG